MRHVVIGALVAAGMIAALAVLAGTAARVTHARMPAPSFATGRTRQARLLTPIQGPRASRK